MNEMTSIQATPHSIEAEQQLLGALLLTSDARDKIGPTGDESLFYDPVHAAIYTEIMRRHALGELVSPVALAPWAGSHEGVKELGGSAYLVRLAGASIAGSAAPEYAKMLADWREKRRLMDLFGSAQAELLSDAKGAGEVAGRVEAALMAVEGRGGTAPVSMMNAVTEALRASNAAYSGEETSATLTHFGPLDRMLGGFYPAELILLAGRPSMGKTAAAISIALNVARCGQGVAIASLEMTPEALALRAISEGTAQNRNAVNYANIRRGEYNEAQQRSIIDAARLASELPIQILPQEYRDIGSLFAGAKRAKTILGDCGLRLLVVDYLQLLRADGRTRYDQITDISIALKGLAARLHCPVLALSQLSRAVEQRDNKRPMLSDLRDSGQLEQDADAILFCYRDEYYLEREQPDDGDALVEWQAAMGRVKNKLEIIVAKQRQGQIGTAHMRFNPALNLIWEDGRG